jgi:hypothetical protein
MNKRFASAALALLTVVGLGVSANPAQADAGFVPISKPTAATSQVEAPLTTPHTSASDKVLSGGLYAPKGNPSASKEVITQNDKKVSGVSTLAGTVYRTYAVNYKTFTTPAVDNGCSFYATVHSPFVSTADVHSLTECSAHFGQNIVEIGWRKTPTGGPALFSYWWKDVGGVATPQCYNACGFVSSSGTSGVPASCTPGQDLTAVVGQSKMFYIQHFSNVWWLAYDGQWCGYYPDTLFGGTVAKDRADKVQIFDELAGRQYTGSGSSATDICSDMGSNKLPSVTGAQEITKMHVVGGTVANDTWTTYMTANGGVTVNPAHYNIANFANTATDGGNTARNVKAGGPGSC